MVLSRIYCDCSFFFFELNRAKNFINNSTKGVPIRVQNIYTNKSIKFSKSSIESRPWPNKNLLWLLFCNSIRSIGMRHHLYYWLELFDFPFICLQLAMSKRAEDNICLLYELDGAEALGSYLQIRPCSDTAPELSNCSIQWYRISSDDGKRELISGICILFFTSSFNIGRAVYKKFFFWLLTLSCVV